MERSRSAGDGGEPVGTGSPPLRVHLVAGPDELVSAVRELRRGAAVTVAVDWWEEQATAPAARSPAHGRRYLSRLPVPKAGGVIRLIDVGEIDWISAANQYVQLHAGETTVFLRQSMGQLAALLDPDRFLRVHRSTIVNLDRVEELWTESPTVHWVVLADGTRLPVSRGRWEELRAALFEPMVGFGP